MQVEIAIAIAVVHLSFLIPCAQGWSPAFSPTSPHRRNSSPFLGGKTTRTPRQSSFKFSVPLHQEMTAATTGMPTPEIDFLSNLCDVHKQGLDSILQVTDNAGACSEAFVFVQGLAVVLSLYFASKHNNNTPSERDVELFGLVTDVASTLVFTLVVLWGGWLNLSGMVGHYEPSAMEAARLILRTSVPWSLELIMHTGEWETIAVVLGMFAGAMGPAQLSPLDLGGWLWEAATKKVTVLAMTNSNGTEGLVQPPLLNQKNQMSCFSPTFQALPNVNEVGSLLPRGQEAAKQMSFAKNLPFI